MKTHRIVADLLFTNEGPPLRGAAVDVDENGMVLAISGEATPGVNDLRVTVASPGFVNAHCHLELSHLKGRIADDARGMAHFIANMMAFRQVHIPQAANESCMTEADGFMWQEGVVAVGDVSNTRASLPVKSASLIRYHTFVEVMGLSAEHAAAILNAGVELCKEFEAVLGPGRASVTPHAVYSVSRELMKRIFSDHPGHLPLSIHMQESSDELDYCRNKSGPLADLFKRNKVSDSDFLPYGNEYPLLSLLKALPPSGRLQAVHNTFTTVDQLKKAVDSFRALFFCMCPSANMFITGRLPDVPGLVSAGARLTVGTDSLASNDRLSMVKELTLLQEHFSSVPTESLVRWATLHGAQFLGLESEFGSVKPGKTPGFVVLENMNPDNPRFHPEVRAKRISLN